MKLSKLERKAVLLVMAAWALGFFALCCFCFAAMPASERQVVRSTPTSDATATAKATMAAATAIARSEADATRQAQATATWTPRPTFVHSTGVPVPTEAMGGRENCEPYQMQAYAEGAIEGRGYEIGDVLVVDMGGLYDLTIDARQGKRPPYSEFCVDSFWILKTVSLCANVGGATVMGYDRFGVECWYSCWSGDSDIDALGESSSAQYAIDHELMMCVDFTQ
jgi:hypothetical protein